MTQENYTRKITYSAVSTALASVFIILTNFIPLRISLLMLASGCYFVAFTRCGYVFGFLTIVASILISFFTKPFSSAFFLTVLVFAPYSLIAFIFKKYTYLNAKEAIIRIALMAVFSNLVFVGIYFLAQFIDFDIKMLVERFTYVGVAAILTAFLVVFDFFFLQLSTRLLRVIK